MACSEPQPAKLSVTLSGGDELEFTVVHAFTPFTTAEVFTVLTPADTPPHLPFPPSSLIIAKVYDPKVHFNHRKTRYSNTGSGTRSLTAEQRVLSPHVLLLEYIPDTISLRDIDPSVIPAEAKLDLGRSLISAAEEFGAFGVAHADVNPGNVLFTPAARPNGAVVIDFGEAVL
ncbi:hypothetical protein DFH06DRAFT_1350263 [Mycena polygramma]|nr:hypothetical protein DFH06DRAFT_1351339 [Mycena polygramma]KAJ7603402.1 hypothetical protein DFH06DRAFT_1350263 [Mycena polygramma]